MLGNFSWFLSFADFFQNKPFQKILSGIRVPPVCLTVWIQIRPDVLSGLIWVQTVFKCYQQTTLACKVFTVKLMHPSSVAQPPTCSIGLSRKQRSFISSSFGVRVTKWSNNIDSPLNHDARANPALHLAPGGLGQGGGGTLIFSLRSLRPSIYRSPPKNIRNFKHPQKYMKFWQLKKIYPILYLDLQKRP